MSVVETASLPDPAVEAAAAAAEAQAAVRAAWAQKLIAEAKAESEAAAADAGSDVGSEIPVRLSDIGAGAAGAVSTGEVVTSVEDDGSMYQRMVQELQAGAYTRSLLSST